MLSVEEDPSCSYQVTALQSDDRSLDSQAREASCVPEEASTQFSIRDYVSSSRRKDIGSNWPFPQQYLKLCLKHGVSSILPPFERPDSVRSHCYLEKKGSELLIASAGSGRCTVEKGSTGQEEPACPSDATPAYIEHDSDLTPNSLALESEVEGRKRISAKGKQLVTCGAQLKEVDGLKDSKADVELRFASRTPIERRHLSHFPQPHGEKVLKSPVALESRTPPSLPGGGKVGTSRGESCGKKYRLIVKLGTDPELACADEVSSNSSMISDPMASKVCPVCKTFTSTSNTKLNAHIDQCLSTESNANEVMDAPVTHKVKPTKKRSMVDIYMSAPHCTLEDLDRRNGTSWALDLGMLESRKDFCTENKRQKLSPADQPDGEMEKGAVYVDSNGTKICILSKLNAMTPTSPGCESSIPKSKRLGKCIKKQMRQKMWRRQLAPPGNMKAEAARKQVRLLGLLKDHQIRPEASSSQYPIRSKAPRAFRQKLYSSKGSALLKKLSRPRQPNNCEKPSTINYPTPMINSNASSSAGDSKEKSRCNDDDRLIGAFFSEGSEMPKSPQSSRRFASLPKRKAKKDSPLRCSKFPGPQTEVSQNFLRAPVEDGHSVFHKSKVFLARTSSSSVEKHHEENKHKLVLKRLRKHRSGERTTSNEAEKLSDAHGDLDTNNYGADGMHASRHARTNGIDRSTVAHQCNANEDGGCQSPPERSIGAEAVDVEMLQVEHSTDSATVNGIADSGISGEVLASDGLLAAASDSCLRSWARLVENDSFVPGREVWGDAQDQRLLFDDETGNGITISDVIEGNAQVHSIQKDYTKDDDPYMECQTNAQQVIGSSPCSSPVAGAAAAAAATEFPPRGKSSVTSVRIITIHDGHPKALDSELCDSPASGASNISHPAREDLKEQTSEEPTITQGLISDENNTRTSDLGDVLQSGSLTKEGPATCKCSSRDFLTTEIPFWQHPNVWEPLHPHPHPQPCCCCSPIEYVGRETRLLMQCVVPQRKAIDNYTFDGSMLAPGRSLEMPHSPSDRALQRPHGASVRIEQHATPPVPVLRLMGKDLLVANKDEQSQCRNLIHYPNSGQHSSSYNGHHLPGMGSALLHSGNSGDPCPYPSATRDGGNKYDDRAMAFHGNHRHSSSSSSLSSSSSSSWCFHSRCPLPLRGFPFPSGTSSELPPSSLSTRNSPAPRRPMLFYFPS